MVWTLRSDIRGLENAFRALGESNPGAKQAQRKFCAQTRIVCHAALTAAKYYPGVLDANLAATLDRLFKDGLAELAKNGAEAQLKKNVADRYNKLRPYIEQIRRAP